MNLNWVNRDQGLLENQPWAVSYIAKMLTGLLYIDIIWDQLFD